MKFNILQYLPKETKIKIDKELTQALFANKKLSQLSRDMGMSLKNMSRYRNCSRSIPIDLFERLLKNSCLNIENFQGKMRIKVNRMGRYVRIGPIINIDQRWVYVSELIKGDGHISSNFWYIVFVNKNEKLIDAVKNFFISLGLSENQMYIYKRSDASFLTIRSYPIAFILNTILGVPVGKKSDIDIKEFIISDKVLGTAAVRGAFDAEGSIAFRGSRRISITSNSKLWLCQLSKILGNLGIKSSIYEECEGRLNPIYRLFIHHIINLRKFYKIIQPLHPQKRAKLKEIVERYNKTPVGYLRKPILLSIKSGKTRRTEIAKDISQKPITVGNNILWLRKKGLIEPSKKICTNKGSFYEYRLTDKAKIYLESDSLPFFD
jgi:intein/homing endonuclease